MYSWIRKVLFAMDAERAHHLTMYWLSRLPAIARLMARRTPDDPVLRQTVLGLTFAHPVGLAAGLDKDGVAVDGLFAAGFSFVEVGTVTPRPQPGNPLPRLFRLREDEALINRMGFNNTGVEALATRLRKRTGAGLVGVNIGKNKTTPNEAAIDDYLTCTDAVFSVADYIVVNVSSPNTPGLRDLQEVSHLAPLVEAICRRRDELSRSSQSSGQTHRPAVLVKLAPDLSDEAIAALAGELPRTGMDGFIATNTTLSRDGLLSHHKSEAGGLSGRPLARRSTEVIALIYRTCHGSVPIIGSGGILSAADAYEKIRAGASLIELYTGFIYRGPELISEIATGLAERLRRDGFASITEAVGADAGDLA